MTARTFSVALAFVAACSPGGDSGTGGPDPARRGDATTSSAQREAPTTTTATIVPDRLTTPPASEQNVLVGVRVGAHEGYDRVTLEFSGNSPPQYDHELAAQPYSYECVAPTIEGTRFINFVLPTSWDIDAFAPVVGSFDPDQGVANPEATRVTEVEVTCDFEGQLYLTVGLTDAWPYSVSELRNPGRLVVDIDAPPGFPAPAPP